jgi:hypothetical protein
VVDLRTCREAVKGEVPQVVRIARSNVDHFAPQGARSRTRGMSRPPPASAGASAPQSSLRARLRLPKDRHRRGVRVTHPVGRGAVPVRDRSKALRRQPRQVDCWLHEHPFAERPLWRSQFGRAGLRVSFSELYSIS